MNIMNSRIQSRRENGTMIILLAFGILSIFGLAALSIDVSHVHQQERDLFSATDAAALGAAAKIPTQLSTGIVAEASLLARANGIATNELQAIEVGQWDSTGTGTFTPNSTPYNAVRVAAQRNVGLIFGRLIGFGTMTPPAKSVAAITSAGSAYGGGG